MYNLKEEEIFFFLKEEERLVQLSHMCVYNIQYNTYILLIMKNMQGLN